MAKDPIGNDDFSALSALEELTMDIVVRERKPRTTPISLLLTFMFLFGPLFLLIDLFWPNFGIDIDFNLTYVYLSITIIYLVVAIFDAKKYSSTF
ncbi:MAG: hypothetical protein OEZ01_00270 [Candidatus Heimdallarchaeota archaeon]|nr:hypothetical protein [Candidatus Heimdallarchaeota archaeon]MDH5644406.1 hypothetical protein [Candidatus Heimdallarchaeota archaeon]